MQVASQYFNYCKDFDNIPDLILQIGFSNGELRDSAWNPVIMKGFDISL